MAQADRETVDPAFGERITRAIARMGPADQDLLDPPADLWSRIEASVAADAAPAGTAANRRAKQPPARNYGMGTVVEYSIDAADVVTSVGESWADFARQNHAADLATPSPERTLWSYFDREEIREIWRLLIARARATQRSVRVPLRCDAPDVRRWFEVTVTPAEDGAVHFRSVMAFEEPRDPVTLLDPDVERDLSVPPVAVCSWCGRGEYGEDWLDIEDLVSAARLLERSALPAVSQGICAPCREEMSAELLLPVAAGRPRGAKR